MRSEEPKNISADETNIPDPAAIAEEIPKSLGYELGTLRESKPFTLNYEGYRTLMPMNGVAVTTFAG